MAVMEHEMTLADAAEHLWNVLPGHRVEILNGSIVVTPPPDGSHQVALTALIVACHEAGAKRAGMSYVQGIGLWLPTGPGDYAVPDFALVDTDFQDALAEKNCYEPHVFRMVLEVTSSNWSNDLVIKAEVYARARVPVYVIVDRKHEQIMVLTHPDGTEYRDCAKYRRGSKAPLPASLGITLDLDVDTLLDGEA